MKYMKKLLALTLALMLVMGMATTAFAQTVDSKQNGSATITIENASKGVTYSVYKLFDATVSSTGSIAYTGTIPEALATYFTADSDGYISATAAAKDENGDLSEAAINAMKTWAASQNATASAESEGGKLVFTGLKYGYYIVKTTQGTAISVDSTNPNATVYDKNSTEPGIVKKVNGKDSDTVTIGDTVTYTATFTAPNYLGSGEKAELVTKYVITDTLPTTFLSDVKVTSVVIDQPTETDVTLTAAELDETSIEQAFADKTITVAWADKTDGGYVSKYENGSKIVITYTAKVVSNQDIVVDGTTGNVNKVTVKGYTDDDTPDEPWKDTWEDEATILTYAAAFRKVDEKGNPLAGAEFTVNGLILKGDNGLYEVVSYDPNSTTAGTTIKTDKDGYVVIEGLDDDEELSVIETKAPAGYNKLTTALKVKPIVTNVAVESSSGVIYYDANGNVIDEASESGYAEYVVNTSETVKKGADSYKIVNQAGTELPSTGGIGTTIFYTLGGILVLAAVVLLVTKKRMSVAE